MLCRWYVSSNVSAVPFCITSCVRDRASCAVRSPFDHHLEQTTCVHHRTSACETISPTFTSVVMCSLTDSRQGTGAFFGIRPHTLHIRLWHLFRVAIHGDGPHLSGESSFEYPNIFGRGCATARAGRTESGDPGRRRLGRTPRQRLILVPSKKSI